MRLIMNSRFAVRALDPNDAKTPEKVANACSAWKTFLDSMPAADREDIAPSFRRFIDAVFDKAGCARSETAALHMLDSLISLANHEPEKAGTHDPMYIATKALEFFLENKGSERGTMALIHVENNYAFFVTANGSPPEAFFEIMKAYEEDPMHFVRPSAQKCATGIAQYFTIMRGGAPQ